MRRTLTISRGISLLTFFALTSLGIAQNTIPSEVRSVAWSPDGTRLAVGSGLETCNTDKPEDYAIQIIDPETGDTISRLVFHTCTVRSLEWDRFGIRVISSAGADPSLYAAVWDIESASVLVSAPPFSGFPLEPVMDSNAERHTRDKAVEHEQGESEEMKSLEGFR